MEKNNLSVNFGLVDYELKTSSSVNYTTSRYLSVSPESFPEIMENGILVKYEQVADKEFEETFEENTEAED